MTEEKHAIEKQENTLPEPASHYQSFVHEVVTRRFQQKRGDPVGRHSRIWRSKPEPGSQAESTIHVEGDPDVVQEIGDALEHPYDYVGHSPQALNKEREAEVVGDELGNLIESAAEEAPHVLPRLAPSFRRLQQLARLPGSEPLLQLLEAGDKAAQRVEAALEVNQVLDPFTPKFNETEEKGGDKDGSMDNSPTEGA